MTLPTKRFECPHCAGPVLAPYEALDAASAILPCPACGQDVYLVMGKLANYQPGEATATYVADYDDGS